MKSCAACGHQLGLGRFCTNCGHPVEPTSGPAPPEQPDWRTDTAERAATRASAPPPDPVPTPRIPPAAVTPPPPPRFPLYADEVHAEAAAVPLAELALAVEQPVVEGPSEEWAEDAPNRRSWLSWVAVVLCLAVLGVGAWALWEFFGTDGDTPRQEPEAATEGPSGSAGPESVEMALRATAVAPETAPPGEDVTGELTSYDASNMLDGVPETAWRAPGNATGMVLTFRLPGRTTLTSVGMLNGYAKRSKDGQGRTFDWYRGNRRVQEIVWDFGDGTKVRQKLQDNREVQSIDIDPVTTRKVLVRLTKVSAPGTGRASRDFTAISEVSLVGLPPD